MATGASSQSSTPHIEMEERSRTAKRFWQERRAIFSMSVDEVEEDADTDIQPPRVDLATPENLKQDEVPSKILVNPRSRRMSLDTGMSTELPNRRPLRGSGFPEQQRKLQRALSCVQPPKWPVTCGEGEDVEGHVNGPKTLEGGIVCSDEDLQSILCETSQGRRQKLRGSRSLSLDSSFFKLRRAQSDSHAWFSRFLSTQRGEKDSPKDAGEEASVPDAVVVDTVQTSHQTDPAPSASSVQPSSPCRSHSPTSSSSDEEEHVSLLTVNTVVPCRAESTVGAAKTEQREGHISKVLWNEASVVDAGLLGHAIESYLTTTPARKRSVPVGPRDNAAVSASLKGLFVKLIH